MLANQNKSLTDEQARRLVAQLREELERQREANLSLQEIKDERRIVRTEARILASRMRSLGYYKAEVGGELVSASELEVQPEPAVWDENDFAHDAQEPDSKAVYTVNPGPLYRIDGISLQLADEIDTSALPDLLVKPGQALVAERVFQTIEQLRRHITANYCFYQINIQYRAAVSHQAHLASLTFSMQEAQQVNVGEISITGLTTIDPAFLSQKLALDKGDCYRSSAVDEGRLDLLRTNLLARVNPVESLNAEGEVDITFEVKERHHRTVSVGIGYSTDDDFNVSTGWEHRNIFGQGEKLDIDGRVSKRTASLEGEIEFPNFFSQDVALNLFGEGQLVDRDNYQSKSVEAGAELSYLIHPKLTVSVGSEVKYSDVRDGLSANEFYLLSFPFRATWDTTDDLLDPTRGWVVFAEINPYRDIVNANIEFIKSSVSASVYHTLDSWLSPTIAVRAATGVISGEATPDIPADERFYVGGGGSVRGYPFQSLSRETLNDEGERIRIGGSSFQELSTELRFRINQDWGIVTFADGGYAFTEDSPELNETLLWGAGIGLRYYTLVAPLRLDLAFPLDRRNNDASYQLYISLGQAF